MIRPELVLFDIGNVLIEWQPERFFDRVMPKADRKRMFKAVDLHAMNDVIDRGGRFRETIYETADKHPEFREMIRLWHDSWIELAQPAISQNVALNRALRANNVRTAILSNIGHATYNLALERYPYLAEFDQHYISAEMGVIKPDAEIYAMVEAECGLPPDRLLFVDDRVENIDAATTRGWQGHVFRTSVGWAQKLVECGLLSAEQVKIGE